MTVQRLTPERIAKVKSHLAENRVHVLYRCYGPGDFLLYIGCTYSIARRMSSHRNSNNTTSRWLQACMVRHEVGASYSTRTEALAAEKVAIESEAPLFNTQHMRGSCATRGKRAIARYLIVAGYSDLANETACNCWPEYKAVSEYDGNCGAHGHLALPDDQSRAFGEPSIEAGAA